MMVEHLELSILPEPQLLLWEELAITPGKFVLYGGTAIALQLGHRESVDFDFFTDHKFDPQSLYDEIPYLSGSEIRDLSQNTLTCLVRRGDGHVQCSFFGGLSMQVVAPPNIAPNGVKLASLLDLLASKCSTVQKRAEWKDYSYIAAILERTDISLKDGVGAARAAYGEKFNVMASLKALIYTKDLKPQLLPKQEKVIREQVMEVDVAGYSEFQALGPIGSVTPRHSGSGNSGSAP